MMDSIYKDMANFQFNVIKINSANCLSTALENMSIVTGFIWTSVSAFACSFRVSARAISEAEKG